MFLLRLSIDGEEREIDSKGCPFPGPAAFDADVAAMQFGKLLDDS